MYSVSYTDVSKKYFGTNKDPNISTVPKAASAKKDRCLPRINGSEDMGEAIKLTINHGVMISAYTPASLQFSPNTNANNSSPKKNTTAKGTIDKSNNVLTDFTDKTFTYIF